MTKRQIQEELQRQTGNDSVALSSHIDVKINSNILLFDLPDPCGNMQDDKSAFEGWILPIKALIPSVERVELKWDPTKGPMKVEHYNRFLYRVIKFGEMYDWFEVADHNLQKELDRFREEWENPVVINYPRGPKRPTSSEKKYEDIIESLFVKEYPHLLTQKTGATYINQQLPVGVFKREIGRYHRFFTGQKSAIDLWGVDEHGETLHIFELKYNNKGVGIISELFFYLCVMAEVFQKVPPKICYPPSTQKNKYRGFEHLKEKRFPNIHGYFLTNVLHSLVDQDKVMGLFNQGLARLGTISVDTLLYTYEKETKKISWK